MSFFRFLLYNFFVVFFANYLIPGVDVVEQTKIPHFGGDLVFACSLGLLNSLILPVLRTFSNPTGIIQMGMVTLVLNFAAYGLLKFISIGVFVTDAIGYLTVSLVVSIGSFFLSIVRRKTKSSRDVEKNSSKDFSMDETHPPHSEH